MPAREAAIDLDSLISTAQDLDPLPNTVIELCRLVAHEDTEIDEIEACVSADPVLAGNLLGLANSVMMAGVSEVTSVREAVMRVGSGVILSLALGASVRSQVGRAVPAYGLDEGDLWRHSYTAALAAELAPKFHRGKNLAEASTCALMSGLGKLVMARHLESKHLTLLARAREEGSQGELQAEREILGVDHGELAGLVVQAWGLPESMRRALTFFSRPDDLGDALCDTTHVAVCAMGRIENQPERPFPTNGALERLGMSPDSFLELTAAVEEQRSQMAQRFGD